MRPIITMDILSSQNIPPINFKTYVNISQNININYKLPKMKNDVFINTNHKEDQKLLE